MALGAEVALAGRSARSGFDVFAWAAGRSLDLAALLALAASFDLTALFGRSPEAPRVALLGFAAPALAGRSLRFEPVSRAVFGFVALLERSVRPPFDLAALFVAFAGRSARLPF
ncbi:MAG: hypothetical protein ABLT11_04310, partial [Candidatus Acidiferrum sp.]